jgi:plasmid stabilization system protein ParE
MDFKVVWTRTAREDLRELVEFISRDKPSAALNLGNAILSDVDQLQRFPLMGRAVPERDEPTIREIIHRPCRIVYRVREDRKLVEVLRVWHAARGEPKLPTTT